MNLWAVATIMAPNLFLHKAVPSRLTEGAEKGQAEKAADVMRLLIRYQDLLWTVRIKPQTLLINQAGILAITLLFFSCLLISFVS